MPNPECEETCSDLVDAVTVLGVEAVGIYGTGCHSEEDDRASRHCVALDLVEQVAAETGAAAVCS